MKVCMSVRLGIPLLIQEGWLRHQEKDAKPTAPAQTGWFGLTKCFRMHSLDRVPLWTTPSAPLKEASRLLIDVASTPPMSGGEWHAQFIHTFFDPPTHITWTRSLKRRGMGPQPHLKSAPSLLDRFYLDEV